VNRFVVALVLLVVVALPRNASAYSFSCFDAANLVRSGTDTNVYTVVGYGIGVVDFLAGLQCFVGASACGCLSGLVSSRPGEYGEAYGQEIAACINRGEGNSPTFGPALRAARRFCSF
jgi:hypothetical protein